ncbi:MAG: hypothetical protein WC975_13575 [Phycisphaerae bacterium]
MLKKCKNNYVVIFTKSQVSETWYRSFIGLLVGVAIMTLVTFLAGCSQDNRVDYERTLAYSYTPAVSPKMLLRAPGETSIDPQLFVYRSDWPSTPGETDLGQVTTYQEYSYNRQSLAPGVPDFSYNLFQSYRSGTSVK